MLEDQIRTSIGYLVQQFPPEVGAGPARVAEMAVRWRDQGADVTVVTAMPNRPEGRIHPDYRGRLFADERWEGIRVLRSWLYARPNAGFARTLLNNLSFMLTSAWNGARGLGGVDVLIASSPPFFPHLTGVFVSRVRNIPLVLEIRDLWPDYLADMGVVSGVAAKALFGLERWLLSRASRVVVVTESFAQRVVEKGVPRSKIDVLPNAVDTHLYFREETAPPIPELERATGEYLIGYLGHFGRGQALETVVAAAEILADRDPSIRFVLVGDGPRRDEIREKIRGMPGVSITVHAPIPKESTRAFYNSCDICLVPLAPYTSFQATIPSKLFEIMACEVPVVGSMSGEGEHVIKDSGGGVVAEPGSAESMVEAILYTKALSVAERAAMGRRGREYVTKHYNRDDISLRYLEMLRCIVSEASHS